LLFTLKIIQNTKTPCGQKAGPFNVKACSIYITTEPGLVKSS